MPISGSLRILVYHCVYREQLLLTFSIQINLIFYKKMLLMSFFPTPASSWWDLPTPLSLSSFRSFSVLFHLSNGDVAVDPQEIPLVQKQTQKKGKQNKTKVDTKKENRGETVLARPQTYAEKWYVLPHLCCSCFNRDNEGPRKGPCREVGAQQVGASHLLTEHWKPKDEQDAEI